MRPRHWTLLSVTLAASTMIGCSGSQHGTSTLSNSATVKTKKTSNNEKLATARRYRPLVLDYPRDGALLRIGWNTNESHKAPATCIGAGTHDDTGQETFLDLTNVIDNANLTRQFNLSVSASYNAAIAAGSAKYKYAKSVEITDDKDYFAAEAQVLNGVHYVVPPQFSESSKIPPESARPGVFTASSVAADGTKIDLLPYYAQMATQDYTRFLRTCGDSFVSAIHDGGEVTARLQFDVHSIKEKETINKEVSGSYSGLSVSVNADSTLESYQKSSRLKILYYKSGGSGDPLAVDKGGLLDTIKSLAASAKVSPHAFVITVERYETLPSWPEGAQGAVYVDLQHLHDQYAQLKTLFDISDFIKRQPSEFIMNRGVSLKSLEDTQDTLKARLASIDRHINDCLAGQASACQLSGEDAIPDYAYRISFPVRSNSFDEDAQLNANRGVLPNLRSDLAGLKQRCMTQLIARRGQISACDVQGEITSKASQITALEKAIADAEANYPAFLRNAIADQWIRFPVSVRCHLDVHSPNCIDNAKQEEWISKIVTK